MDLVPGDHKLMVKTSELLINEYDTCLFIGNEGLSSSVQNEI